VERDSDTFEVEAAQEFNLSYLPLVKGFSTVGGLRVILVEDHLEDADDASQNDSNDARRQAQVRVLREWDVIGEIWVKI